MSKYFTRANFLYALFILVFTLAALEIFGRIYLSVVLQKSSKPKFRFDSYRIYAHVPGFREGDGKKDWIVINQQGFRRDTEVSKVKPDKTIRIFFLGGSAAHGISSSAPYPVKHIYSNETIDWYLEKQLSEKYKGYNVEVINAAVTGYQVFQHTNYLLAELLDYNPDAVVFFDGMNDHLANNSLYEYYGSNCYQFWKDKLQDPGIVGIVDYNMLWLSKYSGFARGYCSWRLINDAIKKRDAMPMVIQYEDDSLRYKSHDEISKRGFMRAVQTNLDILKRANVDAIVCFQPILVLRDTLQLAPAEKSFITVDVNCQKLYPRVMEKLTQITSGSGVALVDVNPFFNDPKYKGQELFIDYCHLSPQGGKVAADCILPALDSIVSKRINYLNIESKSNLK